MKRQLAASLTATQPLVAVFPPVALTMVVSSRMLSPALAKGIRTMNNLKKLCLVLSAGSIAVLSLSACSDDPAETNNTAGTSSGGTASTAGTSAGGSSAGTGTAGTGTAGTGTAGTGTAGTGTAGTATGGSGGAAGGSGGSGGSGGASGGSGGASGGSGGGGAGAPSAACTKWCSGDTGLPKKCMGSNLLNSVVDSEAKCLAFCAKPSSAAGLTCWQQHLDFIAAPADQTPHCGHASGKAPDNGPCTAIAN